MKKNRLSSVYILSVLTALCVWSLTEVKAQTSSPISFVFYKGISSGGHPMIVDSIAYSDVDSMQVGDRIVRFFRNEKVVKEYLSTAFDSIVVEYDRSGLPPELPTVWQTIVSGNESKMRSYLLSQRYFEINEEYSQRNYEDSTGNPGYLDSVMVEKNHLWPTLTGYLNEKDSMYAAIMLNDEAYDTGYASAEASYRYFPSLQGEYFPGGADSLISYQKVQVNNSVIRGFFYRMMDVIVPEHSSREYCYTVGGDRVKSATLGNLLSGADASEDACNGRIYYSSEFPSEFSSIWKKPILTEAEDLYRLFIVGANQEYTVISPEDSLVTQEYSPNKFSGGKFLHVARSAAQSAQAVFGMTNTLSGEYDVWVTFASASSVPGVTPLPSSVGGSITYSEASIASDVSEAIVSRMIQIPPFQVDPYTATRVKIAELPELFICYDGFMKPDEYLYSDPENPIVSDYINKKYGLKIHLRNTESILDNTKDHDLYIDCIELIPRVTE